MTIEELTQEIDELNMQINELATKRGKLFQQRAEILCPYKVGDILTDNKGKRQAVIVRISPFYNCIQYEIHGRWILKSGEQGKETHYLSLSEWPHEINK
jgi:hypothetical protein